MNTTMHDIKSKRGDAHSTSFGVKGHIDVYEPDDAGGGVATLFFEDSSDVRAMAEMLTRVAEKMEDIEKGREKVA